MKWAMTFLLSLIPGLLWAQSPLNFTPEETESCQKPSLQNNYEDNIQVIKQAFKSDIGKYCEDTQWAEWKYEKDFQKAHGYSAEPAKLKKQMQAADYRDDFEEPWVLAQIPLLKARESTFSKSIKTDNCGRFIACPVEDLKKSLESKDASFILNHVAHDMAPYSDTKYNKTPAQLKAGTDLASDLQKDLAAPVFCSGTAGSAIIECSKVFKKMIDFAAPSSESITPVSVFQEVFTDKKYIEGARLAALKVLDRVGKNKVDNNANLHDDLYDSYIKTGMSPKQADDAAWNIIAVIASSAQNLGSRVKSLNAGPEFEILKVALSSIALSLPKLDFISTSTGHPYSMPKNVTTTCDIGKPYHFLMTAFLARHAVQNGASPRAAASAAYGVQKAYEMLTTQGGTRNPNRAFTDGTFGDWNNMIRIDTGFSSAAAVYGANAASGIYKEINVDEGIKTIISSGSMMPTLSDQQATRIWSEAPPLGYWRWQKTISSDSGFKYHSELLK